MVSLLEGRATLLRTGADVHHERCAVPLAMDRCINSSCGRFYHPECVGKARVELEEGAWVW